MKTQTIQHPGKSRGHVNLGWLDSHHSFSFGHYYDPNRVNFGALRVLNDDTIHGGTGFGTHPHHNMEIITIPLKGALAHKDSTGTAATIEAGEVQVMSAGTGIAHSEYNAHSVDPVSLLQIWILTAQNGLKPRYDQRRFEPQHRKNAWQTIVQGTTTASDGAKGEASPDSESAQEKALWIYQDASLHLAELDSGKQLAYNLPVGGEYGFYLFVIDGSVEVNGNTLAARDALGLVTESEIQIKANEQSYLLGIRVPMNMG